MMFRDGTLIRSGSEASNDIFKTKVSTFPPLSNPNVPNLRLTTSEWSKRNSYKLGFGFGNTDLIACGQSATAAVTSDTKVAITAAIAPILKSQCWIGFWVEPHFEHTFAAGCSGSLHIVQMEASLLITWVPKTASAP